MPKVMTARVLTDRVGAITGLPGRSNRKSRAVIRAVINAMVEHLADGGNIELRGFGTFTLKTHKARLACDPNNRSAIYEIPKHTYVKFKPAKQLKRRVLKLPIGI